MLQNGNGHQFTLILHPHNPRGGPEWCMTKPKIHFVITFPFSSRGWVPANTIRCLQTHSGGVTEFASTFDFSCNWTELKIASASWSKETCHYCYSNWCYRFTRTRFVLFDTSWWDQRDRACKLLRIRYPFGIPTSFFWVWLQCKCKVNYLDHKNYDSVMGVGDYGLQ